MCADVFAPEGVIRLTAERRKSAPSYPQIVEDLRSQILSGAYKYNDQLPTEPILMERYGVSRPTAHRALAELEFEGLAEVRRGAGTYVRYLRPLLRNIGKRMSAEVWGGGNSPWDLETEGRDRSEDSGRVHRGEPPEAVVEALGTNDAWIRERRHLVDGCPVMLSRSYYPASIVQGSQITEEKTGRGGSPARLAELGHAPHRHEERFRTLRPSDDQRKRLQLPRGTKVVEITRVSWDADGQPVEVTEMVANSDVYTFQVDYTS
jgi:GntR family transcriptional regulator